MMTSSKSDQAKVEVYLITRDSVEGELLAKALNAKGKEIGRSKQMLNLGKDDAKLITFTFDASVNLEEVTRFMLDFRKKIVCSLVLHRCPVFSMKKVLVEVLYSGA